MGRIIATQATIPDLVYHNGQTARDIDPVNLDVWQGYVVSGRGIVQTWAFPHGRNYDEKEIRLPLTLPPWTGAVRVAVRGIRTATDGAITLQLRGDQIGGGYLALTDPLVLSGELDTGDVPATEGAWGGATFAGLGGLQGQGTLALTKAPTNGFVACWVNVVVDHCALHSVSIRPFPSSQPLSNTEV